MINQREINIDPFITDGAKMIIDKITIYLDRWIGGLLKNQRDHEDFAWGDFWDQLKSTFAQYLANFDCLYRMNHTCNNTE